MIRAKGNTSLQILVYSTPRPKLKTFVGVFPLAPRNYFLLAPTQILLGIGNFRRFLLGDSSLLSPVGVYYASLLWGTKYFPVEVLICFAFLGELHALAFHFKFPLYYNSNV